MPGEFTKGIGAGSERSEGVLDGAWGSMGSDSPHVGEKASSGLPAAGPWEGGLPLVFSEQVIC